MSKPMAEVHAGRVSVQLQTLTFSVADVLQDIDPLVDKTYQLQNTALQNGQNKVWHIAWASNQPARNCESIASLLSVFPVEIKKTNI